MKQKTGFSIAETNSSQSQIDARIKLIKMFRDCELPDDELMTQLGLFIRSSYLVKFLVLNDLYNRIQNLPGDIIEFGTRFGHNLIVFENLRSIYEPFNKTRKIIGFDTFQGYKGVTSLDSKSDIFSEQGYSTPDNYKDYLEQLLIIHEQCNVLGHINGGHRLIDGDVCETAPEYFKQYPETIVSLAYFDMGLYKPTKVALESIKLHLIPGSLILLDEFTWAESPGEAIAFKEVFGNSGYRIEKSSLTPMRAIITII
jgi:hypothetical protein